MLIYNTTYHVEDDAHDNFLIWIKEVLIPETEQGGQLKSPRLCRLLSHQEEGSSYTLQWEVADSAVLHRWHMDKGAEFNREISRIFGNKVVGFPTLMEVME